jgi:hypothetical protein
VAGLKCDAGKKTVGRKAAILTGHSVTSLISHSPSTPMFRDRDGRSDVLKAVRFRFPGCAMHSLTEATPDKPRDAPSKLTESGNHQGNHQIDTASWLWSSATPLGG